MRKLNSIFFYRIKITTIRKAETVSITSDLPIRYKRMMLSIGITNITIREIKITLRKKDHFWAAVSAAKSSKFNI